MNGRTILIVDDDPDVRLFVRTSLEAEGYSVIEAPDGDTALLLFIKSEPAAIVLDLELGQPDGLEVCRRIRQRSSVPIIMLTWHTAEADQAICLAAGADDYVSKTVSGRIIALRVAAQLKRAPVQMEPSLLESHAYSPSQYLEDEAAPLRRSKRVLIGAILATLIVTLFIGLIVANSQAPAVTNQVPAASGVQTMSATELIQGVKAGNKTVYWLNAKPGDSYSYDNLTNGVDQISYRPEGSDISNLNQFDVKIGTYQDISTYDAQPHTSLGGRGVSVILNNGSTLAYNAKTRDRAVVTFPDRPEVVVLNYPAAQTLPTLIGDAQKLVAIK